MGTCVALGVKVAVRIGVLLGVEVKVAVIVGILLGVGLGVIVNDAVAEGVSLGDGVMPGPGVLLDPGAVLKPGVAWGTKVGFGVFPSEKEVGLTEMRAAGDDVELSPEMIVRSAIPLSAWLSGVDKSTAKVPATAVSIRPGANTVPG